MLVKGLRGTPSSYINHTSNSGSRPQFMKRLRGAAPGRLRLADGHADDRLSHRRRVALSCIPMLRTSIVVAAAAADCSARGAESYMI